MPFPLTLKTVFGEHDIIIEVFIRKESQHGLATLATTTCQETVTDSIRIEAGFVEVANLLGLLGSLPQIGIDISTVAQIIANHRINIGELEGRIWSRMPPCLAAICAGGGARGW